MAGSPVIVALSPESLSALRDGGHPALARAVLAQVALWFAACDHDMAMRRQLGAAHVVMAGASGPLLAAAFDVYDVFALSPEGRQAIADFLGKPVFEEPERE